MFLSFRSPKGGNPLGALLDDVSLRKGQPNITINDEYHPPEIKENYYCILLGYADRDIRSGERLYIRPEEIAKLFKTLNREVKRRW